MRCCRRADGDVLAPWSKHVLGRRLPKSAFFFVTVSRVLLHMFTHLITLLMSIFWEGRVFWTVSEGLLDDPLAWSSTRKKTSGMSPASSAK